MSIETEKNLFRRTQESRESGVENRENQEIDPELAKAATMERADLLVKEVKQSKQQMQNIILHMQTVLSAIRQLRQQLQLAQTDDDISSVKQDKKQIEILKKKIQEYGDELEKMRKDLVREQMEELKNGVGVGLSSAELQVKAEEMVELLIKQVKQ